MHRATLWRVMTGGRGTGTLPAGLTLGDECELREPVAKGAERCNRWQDLTSDEIAKLPKHGRQVCGLGVTAKASTSFVLGLDLSIRKLNRVDVVVGHLGADSAGVACEVDAPFPSLTLEIFKLPAKREEWFVARRSCDA